MADDELAPQISNIGFDSEACVLLVNCGLGSGIPNQHRLTCKQTALLGPYGKCYDSAAFGCSQESLVGQTCFLGWLLRVIRELEGSALKVHQLADMKGGWFVGYFNPTVISTSDFGVGVKVYPARAKDDCQ